MLSGSLVVPNMWPRTRKNSLDIAREFPYGGLRTQPYPDILYVCHNTVHRDLVAHTFKDRAMYILYGSAIAGRRFNSIVLFDWPSSTPGMSLKREYEHHLTTHLCIDGNIVHYTYEQQLALGIYR